MEVTILFFFLVAMAATSQTMSTSTPNPILLLRPYSGAGGHRIPGIDCLSWRLAVETNNLRQWKLVPEDCEDYVGHYMLGKQYRDDCNKMAEIALEYAESVELVGDGKDVWVFDIDETSLSDLPYYARSDVAFGAIAYNDTKFDEWLAEGIAPAIPAVHKLYEKLLSLGFKIIFLSGSAESLKDIRISNLKGSGYHTWEKLILKKDSEKGTTALVYKSNKRKQLEEEEGYRIWGNVGDQWSDLLGTNVGNRTFKVPNPMFYIG